ncbi:protein ATP6V1FNB-like [Pristis pectinata]|uniref:protein ATP6V1FNB-like n=1 Tax=Pristis pectinata TaxID=685728 RepID=UPI00223E1C36|nr:protein ATP6V1FNB-like [Pristis pectinata]
MDTQLQNFWKESITKEDLLRLCWLRRFKGDLSKPPARETKRKRVPTLPHIDVQTQEAAVQEKEGSPSEEEKQKDSIAEEQAPAMALSDMRPVTPEVRALLYDGFSKEDKGRYLYLKARMKKGPSEKYEYPLTSSWNYGWKIEDDVEYKKPGFGRSALVETAFYRRNGIFSKPEANDAMN